MTYNWLKGKTIAITGGTGSFGIACTKRLLEAEPAAIRIISRDEYKHAMLQRCINDPHNIIRWQIGDVRDSERMDWALSGVDIVFHAAALKHVPVGEYNPFEVLRTNVHGTEQVIRAAIKNDVEKVILISSDKAVYPINLYGASKMAAEKMTVAANSYAGHANTRLAVVRYGNVLGSRGSVIQHWQDLAKQGQPLSITDIRATRFWLTLDQAITFVLKVSREFQGGEIFVPRIPSLKILDMARAVSGSDSHEVIGLRPGEKLHETMISSEEIQRAIEHQSYYMIQPESAYWPFDYTPVNHGRHSAYTSDNNDHWLKSDEIKRALETL